MKKQEQEVLSCKTTNKKDKKEAAAKLREGIAKFETALTVAVSEGNKQAQIAAELSLKGLRLKLENLKKGS
jgi:hypothetical protein